VESRRVLIVDDNEDARETLADLCEYLGHEVLQAGDGASAVRLASDEHPDIAVVDVGLPGMDGHEVARRIRRCAPETILIALTGYGEREDVEASKRAGFDRHIVKPLDFPALERLRTVQSITGQCGLKTMRPPLKLRSRCVFLRSNMACLPSAA
jgi:CheY-like chemotaxis protein